MHKLNVNTAPYVLKILPCNQQARAATSGANKNETISPANNATSSYTVTVKTTSHESNSAVVDEISSTAVVMMKIYDARYKLKDVSTKSLLPWLPFNCFTLFSSCKLSCQQLDQLFWLSNLLSKL